MEKVSKRESAIQEVKESVSLLNQLLQGFSRESSSHSNQELVKVSELTLGCRHAAQRGGLVPPCLSVCLPSRICTSAVRR